MGKSAVGGDQQRTGWTSMQIMVCRQKQALQQAVGTLNRYISNSESGDDALTAAAFTRRSLAPEHMHKQPAQSVG
jgi:hypothetical protein